MDRSDASCARWHGHRDGEHRRRLRRRDDHIRRAGRCRRSARWVPARWSCPPSSRASRRSPRASPLADRRRRRRRPAREPETVPVRRSRRISSPAPEPEASPSSGPDRAHCRSRSRPSRVEDQLVAEVEAPARGTRSTPGRTSAGGRPIASPRGSPGWSRRLAESRKGGGSDQAGPDGFDHGRPRRPPASRCRRMTRPDATNLARRPGRRESNRAFPQTDAIVAAGNPQPGLSQPPVFPQHRGLLRALPARARRHSQRYPAPRTVTMWWPPSLPRR